MPRLVTVCGIVAGYAAVVGLLFWRVWLDDQISAWDCVVEYWPDLVFQIGALGDGEWPGWNPYALGGYPAWADPQAGLYAPVNWLIWPLAGVLGDGPWMIQAKVLLNLVVGLSGMHAWMWWRTRSHAAAAVAAIVFVVGAPLLVHKNGALLWPVLYWPWMLLALERLVAGPSIRRGAQLGGALWLVGSAGHPQTFFYGLVLLVLYWVFLSGAERRFLTQARGGVVAIGLATMLLAATWIPASGAIDESSRAVRDELYALQEPLEPGQLEELLVPALDDDWQADVYVGALPLVGGLWLLVAARGRARQQAAWWLAIAGLGLLLALGEDGYLLPWLTDHVPGFDLFRIAYRYKLIFGLASALLAGEAVAAALRVERRLVVIGAWLALVVAWVILVTDAGGAELAWVPPLAVLAAATVAIVAASAPQVRRVAAVALPLLVLADLWDAGADKLAIMQPWPDRDRAIAAVAPLGGTDGHWRYHVSDAAPPYGGTIPYEAAFLARRREWSGYLNPIEPARHADIELRAREAPALLKHFNVKYVAAYGQIVEMADVAPIARWYGSAELMSAAAILDRLSTTPPSDIDAALVEPADVAGLTLPESRGQPVDGRLVHFGRGEVVVSVDAPAQGILVLDEAWAPGWEAEIGGREAPVFRAMYHLRAVVVPAGASVVRFRYAPRGQRALPIVFLVGLGALGFASLGRRGWRDEGTS